MKRRTATIYCIIFFILALVVPSIAPAEDSDTAIQYLLDYVRHSDVVFIRNDKAHTPSEAAAHMEKKYDYHKEKIQTPEEFIRYAATKSMISGKRYEVRMKNGKTVPTEKWLIDALKQYRLNTQPLK
jgi:hypothetical protein